MATATLPLAWKGRAGRAFMPVSGARVRHGRIAAVRKVQAVGAPKQSTDPSADVPLALKLWTEGGEASLDQLQREIRTLSFAGTAQPPIAPRVIDVIGSPAVVGVVLEWCPGNLEDWWARTLREPDAFGRLMTSLAEVARQVDAWHTHAAGRGGLDSVHGDLKPTNILLGSTGSWLISDFGVPPVDAPEDSPWAESDVVAGAGSFLAPELRFHARITAPRAIDVWSLGVIAYAMIRMRRVVLDGSAMPRNGTASPRFSPSRADQVLDVYRSEPARFVEKPLDPTAFSSPENLPQADRSAVRESLRGALGDDDEELEGELTESVLAVLDRALAVGPERRFPDAASLANAFDDLARRWITLAARHEESAGHDGPTAAALESVMRERDVARARAAAIYTELGSLQDRFDSLQGELEAARAREATAPLDPPPAVAPAVVSAPMQTMQTYVIVLLCGVVLFQVATLVLVTGLMLLNVLAS